MADKTMIPHRLPLSYLQGLEGKHAADGLRGCWPSGRRHTSTLHAVSSSPAYYPKGTIVKPTELHA